MLYKYITIIMAKSYYRKTMESRNQCDAILLKIDISKNGS